MDTVRLDVLYHCFAHIFLRLFELKIFDKRGKSPKSDYYQTHSCINYSVDFVISSMGSAFTMKDNFLLKGHFQEIISRESKRVRYYSYVH